MDLESYAKVKDNGKLTDAGEVEGTVGTTEVLPEGSVGPSQSPATKGRGLKKWRRIHREFGKESNSNFDSNKKRGMTVLPVGRNQRSEGSSSSTNAMSNVLGNALDRVSLYGDLSSRKGQPDSASRADSENSRSSTAASAPRGNHELPVLSSGFNAVGKNSGSLVQVNDRQDKRRDVRKKAREVKLKKENSISSMESDSRSSNSVFLQGANSLTSNGRRNGGSGNYDEDDSDDHVEPGYPDALAESITPLHLAQEALEKEVQKLREVGKDEISSSEEHQEHQEDNLQEKLEEAFIMLELKNTKISELESTLNSKEIKTEYDELLTRRYAAEVEYIVISRTIETLKASRVNLTVEQKNVSAAASATATATARSLEEEEDEKKLKNKVWRYVYCVMIQLVLLCVVLHIFVLKFSSKSVEVIPT